MLDSEFKFRICDYCDGLAAVVSYSGPLPGTNDWFIGYVCSYCSEQLSKSNEQPEDPPNQAPIIKRKQ